MAKKGSGDGKPPVKGRSGKKPEDPTNVVQFTGKTIKPVAPNSGQEMFKGLQANGRLKGSAGHGGKREKHVPTDAIRNSVCLAMGMGLTYEQAAAVLMISVETLTKYYQWELDFGAQRLNMAIAGNIATMAQSRTHPKAATCAIYWTKTRMGWKEVGSRVGDDPDEEKPQTFTISIGNARGPLDGSD